MRTKDQIAEVRSRASELLTAGKDRDLTPQELEEVETLTQRSETLTKTLKREEESQANLRAISGMAPADGDQLDRLGGPATKRWTPGQRHPWTNLIEARTGRAGQKDWTSGSVSVPMLFGPGVTPMDRPPTMALDLFDYRPLEGTGSFATLVQTLRDLNAAVVPRGQEKPESRLGFDLRTADVETIATHATPIPRQYLEDIENLNRWIGEDLQFGIEEELVRQVLTGDGTGDNLLGILDQVGTPVSGADAVVLIRRAIADLAALGVAPTAVLMNTADDAEIDLMTDDSGAFFGGGPFGTGPATLWGLPRISTPAMPQGTALVGDFRAALVVMRQTAQVLWSDSHADTFTHNLVTAVAELRAGFMLVKPYALVAVSTEQIGPAEPAAQSAPAPTSSGSSPASTRSKA